MRVNRHLTVLFAAAGLIVVLAGVLAASVTAAPPGQMCGNACGIPGCATCQMEDGLATCTSWCTIEATPVPTEEVHPTPGGPTPTPGGGPPPTPGGPTPTPGPGGLDCYSCIWLPSDPLADFCDSGYFWACFYTRPSGGKHLYDFGCNTIEECEPSDGPSDEGCIPGLVTIGGGSAGFPELTFDRCEGIDWEGALEVWASVPPHKVQVDPFPRWMVAMGAPLPDPFESGRPGRLTLQGYPAYSTHPAYCGPVPNGEGGCWSQGVNVPDPVRTEASGEEDPLPGDVKGYRIGLRWRRLDLTDGQTFGPVAPICWDFDEREWNIGQDYGYGPISNVACGTAVSHIYETSSWGKPANGPNFYPPQEVCSTWTEICRDQGEPAPGVQDRCHCCEQVPGEWNNPAYQITVPTYWGVQWKVEWYAWEVVGGESRCAWIDAEGNVGAWSSKDPPTECDLGWEGWEYRSRPRWGWQHHENGWNALDLRLYDSPTWYYQSWTVETTGSGPWCEFEYGSVGTAVRVPVIEVQSVLRDPCILDGTCPKED